jgi:hypothetical protein
MKIREWLGYNEYASPYALRPGELRALVNLQPRRRGMLTSRQGLAKIFGSYSNEPIVAMYRQDTPFGKPDVLYVMQRSIVPVAPPEDGDWQTATDPMAATTETKWTVSRLTGRPMQAEEIDRQDLSPDGESFITDCCFAEDRHGRVFIFYGHGATPKMYRPNSDGKPAVDMGLLAPTAPPAVEPEGEGYFISRVDVTGGGGSYWGPPSITVAGGSPERPAKLRAVVQAGSLVAVDVIDGGFNYKEFPSITVGTDKTGVGFLGTGVLATDPGLQGFSSTSTFSISPVPGHPGTLTEDETFATRETRDSNEILYLGSDVTSLTTWTPADTNSTSTMTFTAAAFPSGARVGDYVSMSPRPTVGMNNVETRHRVVAINTGTRTVTLSKAFTPSATSEHRVLFRSPPDVRRAPLVFDVQAGAYTCNLPLETITGAGQGAEATLSLVTSSKTRRLGADSPPSGWTAYTEGNIGVIWGTKENNWDNLSPNFWGGLAGAPANNAQNNNYAGLQAHGGRRRLGFTGTLLLQGRYNRPAAVWWPDYSHIRIWLNTGVFSDSLREHTAVDVPVEGLSGGSPYIDVTLEPTLKSRQAVRIRRRLVGRRAVRWTEAPGARKPRIRIYLRACPESWITNDANCLPARLKNANSDRLAWWSPTSGLPRPIVDFQGAGGRIDAGTIEVLDPGAGWEPDTVFSFRIFQGNPYAATTLSARTGGFPAGSPPNTRAPGHRQLANRYQAFYFRATANDELGGSGPPNQFGQQALQRVERGGDGYRDGDIAQVTLLRRDVGGEEEDITHAFSGYVRADGLQAEWTGGPSSVAAGEVVSLSGSVPPSGWETTLRCLTPGVLFPFSGIHSVSGSTVQLLIATYPDTWPTIEAASGTAAQGSATITGISLAATIAAGQTVTGLPGSPLGELARVVLAVGPDGNGTLAADLSGPPAASSGAVSLRRVYDFVVERGIRPARTPAWTATTITSGGASQRIIGVRIVNGGRNYQAPPQLLVRGGGDGYGLQAVASVTDGRVTSVRVVDAGANYSSPPELYTASEPGSAVPVMRPHLRGIYRCAFRYADLSETVVGSTAVTAVDAETTTQITVADATGIEPEMILESAVLPHMSRVRGVQGNTVTLSQEVDRFFFLNATPEQRQVVIRDMTRPISYSDFSPIADVNAGPSDTREQANEIVWNLAGVTPPPRADMVEFYRTSADQSLVFYRLEMYGKPTADGIEIVGKDTMTDEDLFDAERPNYAAVPVVLPNGNLNAYRFGQPRKDMKACAAFRDRLWYGVSTSGQDTNSLFFSEYDEFESCPDLNELPIQNNQRTTDSLTAIVPFGSILLAMQHKHTYGVTYNTDPGVDASIQMMAHRGCLNQRCWDIHQNTLYAADESGIYAMTRNGEVQSLSDRIAGLFDEEILDFANRDTFFLSVCERTGVLRFFCSTASNPTTTPSLALCYSVGAQTWWVEQYPNSLTAAVVARPTPQRSNCTLYGATDGNIYELLGQADVSNDGLLRVEITEHGSGYTASPTIMAPTVYGAFLQGVVSEGRFVDALIHASGWGAYWGAILASEDSEPLIAPEGYTLAASDYVPFSLEIGPPDIPGGIQAEAVCHYTRPWRVPRRVAIDDPSLPILKVLPPLAQQQFMSLEVLAIADESGPSLEWPPVFTPSGPPSLDPIVLTTEPLFIEPGMEVFGGTIPLGTYVDFLAGDEVHLRDEFGNPVLPSPLMPAPALPTPPPGQVALGPNVTYDPATNETYLFGTLSLFNFGNYYSQLNSSVDAWDVVGATLADGVFADLWWRRPSDGLLVAWRLALFALNQPTYSGPNVTWTQTEAWLFVYSYGGLPAGTEEYRNAEEQTGLDFDGDGLIRQSLNVLFYKPFKTAIPYRLATGAMQLANEDSVVQHGDKLLDRSVTLLYSPTDDDKRIELVEYFNEDSTPSPNIHRRARGGPGAFEHRQDSASTVLNMSKRASGLGRATGVAKATFASRVLTDATGEQQHIRVELVGRPTPANQGYLIDDPLPADVTIHSLTIDGVVADEG